jgi:hypothetical protein
MLPQKTAHLLRQRYPERCPPFEDDRPAHHLTCPHLLRQLLPSRMAPAMSRLVHLKQHVRTPTLASAVAAFLLEHDLSPGSQRVYAGALRSLQLSLGVKLR